MKLEKDYKWTVDPENVFSCKKCAFITENYGCTVPVYFTPCVMESKIGKVRSGYYVKKDM